MKIHPTLDAFKFASLRFTLRADESFQLPHYIGSTLRGGFGTVFKKVVCISLDRDCTQCLLKENCAYSYIFETQQTGKLKASYDLPEYPHPFIIEPPAESKCQYESGDELTFTLTLIGKAIDFLPYFVFVYQELGRKGIGKGRGKYTMKKVESLLEEPRIIYNADSGTLSSDYQTKTFADIVRKSENADVVSLEFLTPTRVKHRGKLTTAMDFTILMKNLLRRTMLLSELHCGEKLEFDHKELLKKAGDIEIVDSALNWQEWERYSSRQKTRIKLGGFAGRITFSGELTEFMPFIRLGEYIHIGKGTSFGLGKYEVVKGDRL